MQSTTVLESDASPESRRSPQRVERERFGGHQICETCSYQPVAGESIAEHISRKHLRGRGGYC